MDRIPTTSSSAAASERWERDYALVRDALTKVKKGDDTKAIDLRIKKLEQDLANLVDDGTLSHKRLRRADLVKSLLLRQSDATTTTSQMSSFSNDNPPVQQSTEQLLEEQNAAMRRQDRAIEGISRNLGALQTIGSTMRDQVDLHVGLLDNIDEEAHGVSRTIQVDTRRVRDVAAASDTRNLRCTIFILVAIFIVMLILKI
jgi:hypothetical protein